MTQSQSSAKDKQFLGLRKSSTNKLALKEKVVQIYEAFFQGIDMSSGNPNFWDELFLLRVNSAYIECEFEKLTGEALVSLKESINQLFYQCVETLRQDNPIRVFNALQTICSLIRGVFRKSHGDCGFDVINILIGFDSAEVLMQNLIETIHTSLTGDYSLSLKQNLIETIHTFLTGDYSPSLKQNLIETIHTFLTGDYSLSLKQVCLKFMLVLVTATDNISANTLLEYVMINSVYEALIQILGSAANRQVLGSDTVLLLTLLIQYRKYESVNPYVVKLSILDDELAMTGYAQVVSQVLCEFNREFQGKQPETPTGWFNSFTNMVGNMLVGEEKVIESVKQSATCERWARECYACWVASGHNLLLSYSLHPPLNLAPKYPMANDTVLLALYEAIHLNRNFLTALTHSHTPSTPTSPVISPDFSQQNPLETQYLHLLGVDSLPTTTENPTNLLVTFLEYSSIVMQDTKDVTRYNNVKLCLIILSAISEDQYANSIMHDININFRVPLHRTPMRHRKLKTDLHPPSRPLVMSLLDLMIEFTMSHMMKTFPMELYLRSVGIIHRVLCHQKKCRIRLQYDWTPMWAALISLLKFLLSHETQLSKKHNIFHLCSKVVNVFNLFITYGDTFLPNPNSYDDLYYELIRMHQVFDNLYSMGLRYITNDGDYKDTAIKLTNHLVNIRAIINHFCPKVDNWAATNHIPSLTAEQVLGVVRENYDSLTLKLQDSLDQFDRYSEKPRETAYFTQLVRTIVADVRKSASDFSMSQDNVLKLFGTIT